MPHGNRCTKHEPDSMEVEAGGKGVGTVEVRCPRHASPLRKRMTPIDGHGQIRRRQPSERNPVLLNSGTHSCGSAPPAFKSLQASISSGHPSTGAASSVGLRMPSSTHCASTWARWWLPYHRQRWSQAASAVRGPVVPLTTRPRAPAPCEGQRPPPDVPCGGSSCTAVGGHRPAGRQLPLCGAVVQEQRRQRYGEQVGEGALKASPLGDTCEELRVGRTGRPAYRPRRGRPGRGPATTGRRLVARRPGGSCGP